MYLTSIAIAPTERWWLFVNHNDNGIIKVVVMIIAIAPTERWWLSVNHNDNGITGVSGNSRSRPFPRMRASDSRSRIMGMYFFLPFLFPICGNGFFLFPSRSWIYHFTDGNHNGNWKIVRNIRLPIFLFSSTFLTTIYIEEVNFVSIPVPVPGCSREW